MRRNYREEIFVNINSSRSGNTPLINPATLLSALANLLTKGRIKYGLTGSVRVKVRVRCSVRVSFYG